MAEPDEATRAKLEDLLDCDWDDVLVIIETSATKSGRTNDEVIADLLERSQRKTPVQAKVKRGVIRWIGKPWRERENPWDRFKDKVPPVPPLRTSEQDAPDLDEWTPIQPVVEED